MRWVTVDKDVVAQRFSRSMATYENEAVVQREMAAQLTDRLIQSAGTDCFENVLELGCGTGLLTRYIADKCRIRRMILNDLVPGCEQTAQLTRQRYPGVTVQFIEGDMETAAFPLDQDLIVSNAVIQWAADLRGLTDRMATRLKPGGILAVGTFGPGHFHELAELTDLSLRYGSVDEWRSVLADNYEMLSGTEHTRILHFSGARDVLSHLQRMGANSLDRLPWSPKKLTGFCREYDARFSRDGKTPLSYHSVLIVARKHAKERSLA